MRDVHDLHATRLRLLRIDHEQLTYKFQGCNFRLTDVNGTVVTKLSASRASAALNMLALRGKAWLDRQVPPSSHRVNDPPNQ